MIQPIMTSNQAAESKINKVSFGGYKNSTPGTVTNPAAPDGAGEKLDINCEGCRIHSLNGNKVNYFA